MKSLAIFAYNEADIIAKTLASLETAGFEKDDQAYVLINGCSDNTLEIVQEISKKDQRIHPIEIKFGDKANAWDVYVASHAPKEASIHIFLDGDVLPSENAFTEMQNALDKHPEALAVSTMPAGGRKSESWAKRIAEKHGMPGNMYGLRKETFQRIYEMPIRLPIGYVGDDPLLRFLLLRDLNPQNEEKLEYIRPVETAFFEYESFPLNTYSGIKAVIKRQIHYSRRDLEQAILIKDLKEKGISAMPRRADELWPRFFEAIRLQERFTPCSVFFPYVFLKTRLKRQMTFKAKAWDE